MKELFSHEFNNINFEFKRLVFKGNEVWYEISFNDNGNKNSFRMYRDEEGAWRMAAQLLPSWIRETDVEFSEIINTNENS